MNMKDKLVPLYMGYEATRDYLVSCGNGDESMPERVLAHFEAIANKRRSKAVLDLESSSVVIPMRELNREIDYSDWLEDAIDLATVEQAA